jgi:hypothetical protein
VRPCVVDWLGFFLPFEIRLVGLLRKEEWMGFKSLVSGGPSMCVEEKNGNG